MTIGAGRRYVGVPALTPLPYGLLSAAELVTDDDPHWRAGIDYQPDSCEPAKVTLGPCPTPDADPAAKTATETGVGTRGANPFTVWAAIECSPLGMTETEWRARAAAALTSGEGRAVEQVFWTGAPDLAPGAGTTVYPHLAADTEVTDPAAPVGVVVQTAASVPVTGALDVVEAVGVLEGALGDCYGGAGVIHVPREALAHLGAWSLVERDGQRLRTLGGTLVAAGAGYTGSSPAGAAPAAGTAWFYATGKVSYRRSDLRVPTLREALNRASNTLLPIAERTYVIGWDCCHIGVLVSLGGITTGAAGAAT